LPHDERLGAAPADPPGHRAVGPDQRLRSRLGRGRPLAADDGGQGEGLPPPIQLVGYRQQRLAVHAPSVPVPRNFFTAWPIARAPRASASSGGAGASGVAPATLCCTAAANWRKIWAETPSIMPRPSWARSPVMLTSVVIRTSVSAPLGWSWLRI